MRPERAISSRSSSPCSEAASGFEAGWRRQARCSTARSQPRGWSTTRKASPGTSSTAPTQRSPPATSTWRSRPQRRRSTSRSSSTPVPSPPTRRSHWPTPGSRRVIAERCAELLVEFAGGNELRLIGGGWRAQIPRASHPLLPRVGPARRSRARCSGRAGLRRSRGPPDGGRDGSPRRRGTRPRRRRAGGRRRAGAERCSGTRGGRERLRRRNVAAARRSSARRGRRARPGGGRAGARSRSVRIVRLAPLPTAGRTGAPEARPLDPPAHAPGQGETDQASTHSPSANFRSHDSSSTERPTLRSRPSSSSARRRSKPTCATPSASSASHRA